MTCSRPQRNVHRPGFEPGTPWSEIRRPNPCATPPPLNIAFVSVFCKLFLQRYQKHQTPYNCNCDWLLHSLILSFDPSHWCIAMQKCNHNRTVVSLKSKSNRKAMNRNCSNQKPNPALYPKREINKYYKKTKDNENIWPTERAAISLSNPNRT